MKTMNKSILGILKTMAKTPDVKKTGIAWIESKKEMISSLNMQLRKQKLNAYSTNVHVKDFQMRLNTLVSWVSNLRSYQHNFQDKLYNVLCNLLLE